MKVIIIGGVAAGPAAAAQLRRRDPSASITVFERDRYLSYSGCGLPYYLSGELKDFGELVPRDAAYFKAHYDVDAYPGHEVRAVDAANRHVEVARLADGKVWREGYDALVLATGAQPVRPAIPGAGSAHVFTLRSPGDAAAIMAHLRQNKPRTAVVAGSGSVGLEMAESLTRAGLAVTIVEAQAALCPALDTEPSALVLEALLRSGCHVRTGRSIATIEPGRVLLDDGEALPADLVLLAVGVRPNAALAAAMGVRLGVAGSIDVDDAMATSVPGVYACGDCAQNRSVIDGHALWKPLGSTANKMGRVAGDVLGGGALRMAGVAGTSILRLFDRAVASTGLREAEARALGYDIVVSVDTKIDRPGYLGGAPMLIRAVAERPTGRLLGAQIVGSGGVLARIDALATALHFGARAADLTALDLAYAPPFSTVRDALFYTGMALETARDGVAAKEQSK